MAIRDEFKKITRFELDSGRPGVMNGSPHGRWMSVHDVERALDVADAHEEPAAFRAVTAAIRAILLNVDGWKRAAVIAAIGICPHCGDDVEGRACYCTRDD